MKNVPIAIIFVVGSAIKVLWDHKALILFLGIVGLMAILSEAGESTRKIEYEQFKKDCGSRGGFVMQTADGKHCLDKSLQR